jgi:proline dehydrogenase
MLRGTLLFLSRSERARRAVLALPGAQRAARQFVAGETLAQGVEAVRALQAKGMLATLDHLGENVRTAEEAGAARDAYLNVLREIARRKLPSTISVKLTQLGLDISENICRDNLCMLVEEAERLGEFVEVDMESSAYTERTLRLVAEMRHNQSRRGSTDAHHPERESKDRKGASHKDAPPLALRALNATEPGAQTSGGAIGSVGAVIQAYLYRSEKDVRELLKHQTSIRLCKGAYNEPAEVAFPRKEDVDANYVRLTRVLLESGLYHRIATHDLRMINAAKRMVAELSLGKNRFEFQMLYGVRSDLQEQLAKEGYRVRVYIPFGKAWFAYFMRRLAERPANLWFALRSILRS